MGLIWSRVSISRLSLMRLTTASSLCKVVEFMYIASRSGQLLYAVISPYGHIKLYVAGHEDVKNIESVVCERDISPSRARTSHRPYYATTNHLAKLVHSTG